MDPNLIDPGILTLALKRLLEVFLGSFGRLTPHAVTVFQALVVIELVLCAIAWVFGKSDWIADMVWIVLKIGAFVLLITQWPYVCEIIVNSFAAVGIIAGGSTMTVRELTNPSAVMQLGLVAAEPIFLRLKGWGMVSGLWNFADTIISAFAGLGIIIAFAVLSIQLFLTFLEFYVVAGLATILIPWGMARFTAFVGERALGMVVAHGVKVAMLALIASAAFPVVWTFKLQAAPTWGSSLSLLVGCWSIALLAVFAPAIAGGMVAGVPSLSIGMAARMVVGAAMGAGMIDSAARSGGRSPTVNALRKATGLDPESRKRRKAARAATA